MEVDWSYQIAERKRRLLSDLTVAMSGRQHEPMTDSYFNSCQSVKYPGNKDGSLKDFYQ
jgi:hypothetical protein